MLAEIERQLELEGDDGRPQRVRLAEQLIQRALAGDMRAMDLVLKRVAPERLALEGPEGEPGITLALRDYSGLSREDALERWRRDHQEDASMRPAIEAETSEKGSDSAIKKLEEGSVVEMENAKPNHDDKPQPVAWVPLRSDKDKRQKVALVD